MFIPDVQSHPGVFAFRGFLSTLIPVFQCSNFVLIYSVIHLQGFYFSKFLVLKYLKNLGTQSPLVHTLRMVHTKLFGCFSDYGWKWLKVHLILFYAFLS